MAMQRPVEERNVLYVVEAWDAKCCKNEDYQLTRGCVDQEFVKDLQLLCIPGNSVFQARSLYKASGD